MERLSHGSFGTWKAVDSYIDSDVIPDCKYSYIDSDVIPDCKYGIRFAV